MTTAPTPADADAVAVVLDWLKTHPTVAALLGGPAHVSGLLEAPWPHLIVSDGPGGDPREARWDAEEEVTLELVGHPNGAPGKAELKRLAKQLVALLCTLPDVQEVGPYDPVVSRVRPTGSAIYQPLGTGQPSYVTGVFVVIRPPRQLPPDTP